MPGYPLFLLAVALFYNILATASSILFAGGTIIAFDYNTESLQIIRNGSIFVTNDCIAAIIPASAVVDVPKNTEIINATQKIITAGFIDTHRHGWQTVFKTLGSNTSLAEYFYRYGPSSGAALLTADDVYISQLAGLYEALNAGVTTVLDHAHHTWSGEAAEAGLSGSIDSGARVIWSYGFQNSTNYTMP